MKWKLLAEDLVAFCHQLNLSNLYIVAHSMGATVATITASLDETLARKMLLMEPIYLPEALYSMKMSVDQHPLASKSIKRRNAWRDRQEAREYLLARALYNSWDAEMLDLFLCHGMVENEAGASAWPVRRDVRQLFLWAVYIIIPGRSCARYNARCW